MFLLKSPPHLKFPRLSDPPIPVTCKPRSGDGMERGCAKAAYQMANGVTICIEKRCATARPTKICLLTSRPPSFPLVPLSASLTSKIQGSTHEYIPLKDLTPHPKQQPYIMKFSHSLQFNAVPEWSTKYISYSTLKKLIYSLQRDYVNSGALSKTTTPYDSEQEPLRSRFKDSDPVDVFFKALDKELRKIDTFYKQKEKHIYKDFDEIIREIEEFESSYKNSTMQDEPVRKRLRDLIGTIKSNDFATDETGAVSSSRFSINSANDSNCHSYDNLKSLVQRRTSRPELFDDDDFNLDFSTQVTITTKKSLTGIYVALSELKSFIELNQIGFSKALKKFDKSLETEVKAEYLAKLPEVSYIFKPSTLDTLNKKIASVISIYSLLVTDSDFNLAKSELRSHLREHIVWERNTVWRDMLGMERKTQAANLEEVKGTPDGIPIASSINVSLGAGRYLRIPIILVSQTVLKGSAIAFLSILLLFLSPFEDTQQKNCFAILVCASLLWATETIPLYITALLIPLSIVVLGVLKDPYDDHVLTGEEASKYIFSQMWSSVIMLLLGGFTLAAALSKYHVDKSISTWILSKAGNSPPIVLLTIMGVSLFASMWVSNVAAPVLMLSIIQPLLRTLPTGSVFAKQLILGIALASNIGGTASPIASPQNIVALESMDPQPSWGEWFIIALPVAVVALVLVWILLLLTFQNQKHLNLVSIKPIDAPFSFAQWYIVFVTMITIILWCLQSKLSYIFGEMGIIAIIPIIAFYSAGLLVTEDINNYPWNIVLLAMGGIALGKAVSSSGLLAHIAKAIQAQVMDLDIFSISLVFGLLVLVVATFVSHTVAALIIVPLAAEIGNALPEPHPRILIMITALMCSMAMGLPTSGFPNVAAVCQLDEIGVPYLTVGTFITRGVPASVICYGIVILIGFFIMKIINF